MPAATDHIPAIAAIDEDTDIRGKDTLISSFWYLAMKGARANIRAMRNIERDTKVKGDKVIICSRKRNYKILFKSLLFMVRGSLI